MKNWIFVLILCAMTCAGGNSYAYTKYVINSTTKCTLWINMYRDTFSYSRDEGLEFSFILEGFFQSLDDAYAESGAPSITSQWAQPDWWGLGTYVELACLDHPHETIYKATTFVYNTMRKDALEAGKGKQYYYSLDHFENLFSGW